MVPEADDKEIKLLGISIVETKPMGQSIYEYQLTERKAIIVGYG